MKGIVIVKDRVILLRNERNEWELPGGTPMSGELPEDAVARQIFEELNISLTVGESHEHSQLGAIRSRLVW